MMMYKKTVLAKGVSSGDGDGGREEWRCNG